MIPGVQAAITVEEYLECEQLVRADPGYRAALAARGITDLDLVTVEAWGIGGFGDPSERRPAAGLDAHAGCATTPRTTPTHTRSRACTRSSISTRWRSCESRITAPPRCRRQAATTGPRRSVRRAPICARSRSTQPEGPSFTVDGWEVSWQRWRLRVGFTPREGLVLHTIGFEDGDRMRPIIHRASFAELVIPYGDATPGGYRKNAFDLGEYGAGPLTNALELGCDCVGYIHYFDVPLCDVDRRGAHAAQRDLHARGGHRDPVEAHRSDHRAGRHAPLAAPRDLVADHGRKLRVRVLLAPLPGRHHRGRGEAHRHPADLGDRTRRAARLRHGWSPRVWSPPTTSTSSTCASTCASTARRTPWSKSTPSRARRDQPPPKRVRRTLDAARDRVRGPASGRSVQRAQLEDHQPQRRTNAMGEPVAYRLVPGENTVPFARDDSSLMRRAGFIKRHLWVTPVSRRRALSGRRVPQPVVRQRRPAAVDARRPLDRERGRGRLVHVLQPPRGPARGLADHAGRKDRVHAQARRVLRPQPHARRSAPAERL